MTIYGMVLDPCFQNPIPHMTDPANVAITYGQFTKPQHSFYVDQFDIEDVRASRLNHLSAILTSPMMLSIDSTFSTNEVSILANSSEDDLTYIFNIIEFVLFRNITLSETALDEALLQDTDTYRNYVSESLRISSHQASVYIYDTINAQYGILDWVRFSINIGGVIVEFKFWINNTAFGEDYPLSTISEIVPPLSPALLLDPSSITNFYVAILDSNTTSVTKLSEKIKTSDYTNYMSFTTKYISPADGSIRYIPFNVLYKGAVPATLDIRQSIREHLIATELGDSDTWKAIFPDLFIVAQFYIIPMWDNTTVKPTRVMFPSIAVISTVNEKIALVLPDLPETTRINKLEILEAAYLELPIAAVPDNLNQVDNTILELHPTYQRYSPQNVSYQYQDDITKEFTTMLNIALAVAYGKTTDSRLVSTVLDNRVFITFVVDSIEYHVITQGSYLAAIAEE